MGKIKDTIQYPIKSNPNEDDYVIGTDSSTGVTKNFRMEGLATLFANLLNEGNTLYVGYASDDQGTDFSLEPSDSLKYVAFKKDEPNVPNITAAYFAGLWVKYIGDDGVNGADGANGTDGADGADGAAYAKSVSYVIGTNYVLPVTVPSAPVARGNYVILTGKNNVPDSLTYLELTLPAGSYILTASTRALGDAGNSGPFTVSLNFVDSTGTPLSFASVNQFIVNPTGEVDGRYIIESPLITLASTTTVYVGYSYNTSNAGEVISTSNMVFNAQQVTTL